MPALSPTERETIITEIGDFFPDIIGIEQLLSEFDDEILSSFITFLHIPIVMQLIQKDNIQINISKFGIAQILALENPKFIELIVNNKVTIPQFMMLDSVTQGYAIASDGVVELIKNNYINMEQFLSFRETFLRALQIPEVITFIKNNPMNVELLMQLEDHHANVLMFPEALKLIIDNNITLEQLMQLDTNKATVLQIPGITELLRNNIITIQDLEQLSQEKINELKDDPNIIRELKESKLSIEIFIISPVKVNEAQSAHIDSVLTSVSTSATKLYNRYGSQIQTPEQLETILLDMKREISNFDFQGVDENKKEAAIRYINKIIQDTNAVIHRKSNLSIRQLLALSYLAVRDNTIIAEEDQSNSLKQLIEGLYEMQRGYNIDPRGVDNAKKDLPICTTGQFNKLIEKLQGIHPDCEIIFMNTATAGFKLFKIIEKEALKYLTEQFELFKNRSDISSFIVFLEKIIEEGTVEGIYNEFKDKVQNQMKEEFSSIYQNKEESFKELIESGVNGLLPEKELDKLLQDAKMIALRLSKTPYEKPINGPIEAAEILASSQTRRRFR